MQVTNQLMALALPLILFLTTAHGFWRMECRSHSGIARVDPLINPGVPGAHVHAVFGGSGFSMTADSAAMAASGCTSCSVAQDKSAYWHPALYFKAANGEMTTVSQAGGMLAYYLLYPNAGETQVTAFPAGFEMIAGSSNQRNFTLPVPDPDKSGWASDPAQSSEAALAQKAIGFNCLNYAGTPEGSLYRHFLPDKAYIDANCKDGVRFELMFPSCWNGVDKAPPGRKSHMRYPSLVMTGDCPAGYTTRVVSLFYEVIYNTQEFVGQDGEFIIANGDPTGYGYHGDFIMGWDEGFLQSAVNTCTNPSGEIGDCPLFSIQSPATYGACQFPVPPTLQSENVLGPISALPGGVVIQAGPAPATDNAVAAPAGAAPPPAAIVPTLSHSAGSVAPSGSQYEPGNIFVGKATTAAGKPVGLAAAGPTTTPAPTTPLPAGQEIMYTTMITKGSQVMEVVVLEQEVYVTEETTTTITVPAAKRKRHLHQHAARGRS